jgi:hypothetical protein
LNIAIREQWAIHQNLEGKPISAEINLERYWNNIYLLGSEIFYEEIGAFRNFGLKSRFALQLNEKSSKPQNKFFLGVGIDIGGLFLNLSETFIRDIDDPVLEDLVFNESNLISLYYRPRIGVFHRYSLVKNEILLVWGLAGARSFDITLPSTKFVKNWEVILNVGNIFRLSSHEESRHTENHYFLEWAGVIRHIFDSSILNVDILVKFHVDFKQSNNNKGDLLNIGIGGRNNFNSYVIDIGYLWNSRSSLRDWGLNINYQFLNTQLNELQINQEYIYHQSFELRGTFSF